jgi:hypothetical protein
VQRVSLFFFLLPNWIKFWSILHGHVIVQTTFCVSLFTLLGFVLSSLDRGSQAWLTHILLWCKKRPHIVMRVSIASELLSHKSAKSSLSFFLLTWFWKPFF